MIESLWMSFEERVLRSAKAPFLETVPSSFSNLPYLREEDLQLLRGTRLESSWNRLEKKMSWEGPWSVKVAVGQKENTGFLHVSSFFLLTRVFFMFFFGGCLFLTHNHVGKWDEHKPSERVWFTKRPHTEI